MSQSSPAGAYQLFVGVDIAATTATVAWQAPQQHPSKPITLEQTPEGFSSVHRQLVNTGTVPKQTLVVMEATGIYWMAFATFLARQGYGVSIVNPSQAHHFAKALLKRAKTDAIDAQTLARLAALLQPALWVPPPAIYEELEQRLTQRDSLLLIRGQLRNQLHALRHTPVVVSQVVSRMETLDQQLCAQIAQIEAELLAFLPEEPVQTSPTAEPSADQAWTTTITRLQTIPGIGLITAMWIVVATMNFTLCPSASQAAAYAGLAPMMHESGTSVHKRPCIGHTGHRRLRTALYLATLSAARYNPLIKRFYDRLRAQGKPAKVARCAAARKLLHLACAVGTHQEDFDPEYQTKPSLRTAAS